MRPQTSRLYSAAPALVWLVSSDDVPSATPRIETASLLRVARRRVHEEQHNVEFSRGDGNQEREEAID